MNMRIPILVVALVFAGVSLSSHSQTNRREEHGARLTKITPFGAGFDGGQFFVYPCVKQNDCIVPVGVAVNPMNSNDCLIFAPQVVIAPKQNQKITWRLQPIGSGTFRFNTDNSKSIEIMNNKDSGGVNIAFDFDSQPDAYNHSKRVKLGEANGFSYAIRVDTNVSGNFIACTTLDPVIVSRD